MKHFVNDNYNYMDVLIKIDSTSFWHHLSTLINDWLKKLH